ncbi:MAG: aldose 1-epimerase family protein [Pseudolysinimonas sp.]
MHILLESGAVRAEIDTVAAALRSLTVAGAALTEPRLDDDLPPFCNGIVLAPWPNRVRDAKWMLDGTAQQLDITEPDRGGALHGLLQFADYEVFARSDDEVTLSAFIAPQHGWPFALETSVTYALTHDGIRVTHAATNVSARRAPYAVGTHPFLRVGDNPVEQLTLTVPAATYFEVDERLNPTAESPVEGTLSDLRHGPVVGSLELDTAYGSLTHAYPVDGRGVSAWLEAPDGARTTLWQDLDWGYLQVFTTSSFPRPDGLGTAVAVEPMTAPPDALNTGQGLIWIEPGADWSGSWGLGYRGPNG